jgi:hypothetical protein
VSRKYRKGRKLTMRGLTAALNGRRYVFLGDRPVHPGWMGSMQFNTLNWKCKAGRVRAAINNER